MVFATVIFNNPKQRNPFTAELKADLLTLVRDMQYREDVDVHDHHRQRRGFQCRWRFAVVK
jgi:enoyl-CoA hydratase/carnithine racemase